MKWIKKAWARRGIALMMCGVLLMGAGDIKVRADEQPSTDGMPTEIEDNSTQSTATKIQLNTTYVGNTENSNDVDWYEFEIPEGSKGYLNIILGPDADANTDRLKDGWSLGIYKKRESDSILTWGGITSQKVTQNMPLIPGSYCIKIKPDYGFQWTDEQYNLCVRYTPDDSWEGEDISNVQDQNTIALNHTYHGNLTYSSDVDWYEFTLPEYGKLVVNLEPGEGVNTDRLNDGWNLKIYRANDADEFDSLSYVDSPSKSVDLFLNAGKYRIKIAAEYTYESPAGLDTYDLRLDYTKGGNIEHELNDSMAAANPISLGVTYTGNMKYEKNDKDYFVVTPNVSGNLTVSFQRDITSNPKNGFNIKVLDGSNNELAAKKEVTGETESVGPVVVAAGTRYYLLIENNYSYKQIQGVNYHFSMTVKPTASSTQDKTTSAGKKEQKKTSSTNSAEKIQKTSVKLTKVKAAKSVKKRVTLKWKKNAYAMGYKIYRSTKKKGKYKCVRTVRGAKTVSSFDSTAKRKKTYYYKIRAYVKSGRGMVYSKYSSVRKVKVK